MFIGKQRRAKKAINYATLHNGDTTAKPKETDQVTEEILCPGCQLGDDDTNSLLWYGCDVCPKWWHRDCLPKEHQLQADISTTQPTQTFRCPHCPILKLCNVCFVEGETDFAQCCHCKSFYHFDCLPQAVFRAFQVFKEKNLKWYCSHCDIEL